MYTSPEELTTAVCCWPQDSLTGRHRNSTVLSCIDQKETLPSNNHIFKKLIGNVTVICWLIAGGNFVLLVSLVKNGKWGMVIYLAT